jgi:myo-inositol 2-dehydrogenase/D-chiro-inositol 1-dehydrogenase/scyllo-inositol 2-dehydrogenase (NAD+)
VNAARESLGVLVIGAGRAGMVHARNLRAEVPGARLIGVLDSDETAAERARHELELERRYTRLEDALEIPDLDAVVITTPTFTHEDLAVEAASAGKHVLCEKPMALSTESAQRMIDAARENKVVLQMAFMRRFDPAFRAAREQLEAGAIGDVTMIRSLTRGPGLPPAWACDPQTSGGMLAEVNSHDFDTVRWLAGSEYARIYATAAALKATDLAARYPGFYDHAIVTASLRSGALATIDGSCPADYGYDARAEVLGTRGVLFIGEMRDQAVATCTKESGVVQHTFASWRTRFKDAYRDEVRHFAGAATGRHPPAVTGEDGREALRAVLAARESIQTGTAVEL